MGRRASGLIAGVAVCFAASLAAAQATVQERERAFFGQEAGASADASGVAAEAAEARRRVALMLEQARAERDIIRVTCLQDKLTQLAAVIASLEQRRREPPSDHARALAHALERRVRDLLFGAEECVGQDVFQTGETRVVAVADGRGAATRPSIEIDAATRRSSDRFEESASSRQPLAQASPRAPALPQGGAGGGGELESATGGAPILVYRASVSMAVHAIEERQRLVLELARELGGHLHEQTESAIVVRVPAPRFDEALDRIDAIGDVLARRIQVQDVGDEHRDLHVRLQNAEQTRGRLLALLEQASAVDDVLAVQRELERVTLEIEQIRARLRFLDDRIAMSMIRVAFQPAAREGEIDDDFRLPVPWLDGLGLGTLMRFGTMRTREWDDY